MGKRHDNAAKSEAGARGGGAVSAPRKERPKGSRKARPKDRQSAEAHAEPRRRPERRGKWGTGRLPTFVIVGCMKCGSTSLHRYLSAHPEIAMSEKKELNFFYRERVWSHGPDWYKTYFDASFAVRGESSVNYTKSPSVSRIVARRMQYLIPYTKLIYLIRDPVERAISHYVHTSTKGGEERSVNEALADLDSPYVARGLLHANIEPYLRFFSRDDICFVAQEDLLNRRLETVQGVFRFLGVDDTFDNPGFEEVHRTAAESLGDNGSVSSKDLDPPVARLLADHFAADTERLRQLSGLQLGSWSV